MRRQTFFIAAAVLASFLAGLAARDFVAQEGAGPAGGHADNAVPPPYPVNAESFAPTAVGPGSARAPGPAAAVSREASPEPSANSDDSSASIPARKHESGVVLTSQQQRLYDELFQRIETAPYGGFSMSDLQSQMADIPPEHQSRLMGKVVEMVNSGKLDPQTFVEGKRR